MVEKTRGGGMRSQVFFATPVAGGEERKNGKIRHSPRKLVWYIIPLYTQHLVLAGRKQQRNFFLRHPPR